MSEKYEYFTADTHTGALVTDLNRLADQDFEIFQIIVKEGTAVRRPREAGSELLIIYRKLK